MKVQNMTSARGNTVANQFIIVSDNDPKFSIREFQSYDSVIVRQVLDNDTQEHRTLLDNRTWDYSVTTSKYRNQFLGESKKETQAKIDSGEYILTDLNG